MDQFHPLIRQWFLETLGNPTPAQRQVWQAASLHQNIFLSAPTGNGKTLAAFLWALNQLITGELSIGACRILYLSPLKALNNDIRKNLIEPLNQLKIIFIQNNQYFPEISVKTRSGDSTPSERQKMISSPPEILITTPESLNILLTSPRSRLSLKGIHTVILDEIHAVASSKRGTSLMAGVERLSFLCGDFQRIALSATVKPIKKIASFAAGFEWNNDKKNPEYTSRPITIIQPESVKKYQFTVELRPEKESSWWKRAVKLAADRITTNQSTLLFTGSRKAAEKAARLLNEEFGETLVFPHHGSLSKELRFEVEEKMKAGELKGIAATSSLELGIDVGALDEVIMIQAPFSLSSGIQRVGRSGHSVNQTSVGTLIPLFPLDLLEGAVFSEALKKGEIEEIILPENPLDVLTQIIISEANCLEISPMEHFCRIKCCWSYRNLSYKMFLLVIKLLEGQYNKSQIKELAPRILVEEDIIRVRKSAVMQFYLSGGTIPDRGYFDLRVLPDRIKIGELDEEFVWERNIGDHFILGNQIWRLEQITDRDVLVSTAKERGAMIPFWKAESISRDFCYSEKIGNFLESAESISEDKDFYLWLEKKGSLNREAAMTLGQWLLRQKQETFCPLPHRHHVLIEHFYDPSQPSGPKQIVLHCLWGGKVNGPLSVIIAEYWRRKTGYRLQVLFDNNLLVFVLPEEIDIAEILQSLHTENLEKLLRDSLETTGFFGTHFRECASISLLLPKRNFKARIPLWLSRQRSKRLMEAVSEYKDFPVMVETWRTCLRDYYDLDALKLVLKEIADKQIFFSETYTKKPSPFSSDIIYQLTDSFMYDSDKPEIGKKSNLSDNLVHEIALTETLRPKIILTLAGEYRSKRERTFPDYLPASEGEILFWIKERQIFSLDDIKLLTTEIHHYVKLPQKTIEKILTKKLVPLKEQEEKPQVYLIPDCKQRTLEENFLRWLHYVSPILKEECKKIWGEQIEQLINELAEREEILLGRLILKSNGIYVSTVDVMEFLIRIQRKRTKLTIKPLPLTKLPLFIAEQQEISYSKKGDFPQKTINQDSRKLLLHKLEKLIGFPLKPELWERNVFPSRLASYQPVELEEICRSEGIIWTGTEDKKILFCYREETEIFVKNKENTNISTLIPQKGRYDFGELKQMTGLSQEELAKELWDQVWQGRISNDRIATLRKAINQKFDLRTFFPSFRKTGTKNFRNRGFSGSPVSGLWFQILPELKESEKPSLIEQRENNHYRIEQLLSRYGILFKHLLNKEQPDLQWKNLFPTLRQMELSGELISGYFFMDIPGIQFIRSDNEKIFKTTSELPQDFWLNSCDPACLCGLPKIAKKLNLPSRRASTHLFYFKGELRLITTKSGSEWFFIKENPMENKDFLKWLDPTLNQLLKGIDPAWKTLRIKTINSIPSWESNFCRSMEDINFYWDGTSLRRDFF